jgi:hypothetical protein
MYFFRCFFIGVTPGAVLEQLQIIKDIAISNGGTEFHVATTEAETKLLWQCRKVGVESVSMIMMIMMMMMMVLIMIVLILILPMF